MELWSEQVDRTTKNFVETFGGLNQEQLNLGPMRKPATSIRIFTTSFGIHNGYCFLWFIHSDFETVDSTQVNNHVRNPFITPFK